VQSFFSLTHAQATARKWLYAGYVYFCIVNIILAGVREYIRAYALSGNEPIGWALGYLFGDLPWFRFQVVKANLQRWILLPPRSESISAETCHLGRVEHIRHALLGEANTRLFLCGYFLAVIVTGLAVVFRLSPVYEVDTRRKVFHFMMVAMFLPATFVDPTFAALGLSVVLAVFLLLDLLRASQLPPLSKPIANFLTPYVDGRDLRGPVVVSHIFLLIGCAIPLWLSLAALPRSGTGNLAGWEVPSRDVSMVSGVVCVGLGDAAASLIGRRWGRHKWLWGGGKSLEGSVAFAAAVFAGLMAASVWLSIGGWEVSGHAAAVARSQDNSILGGWFHGSMRNWSATVRDSAICASLASLTEAVLTGGNDNVVVPVVLWACVKSTGI
jgi:dolichol kinase